MNTTVIDQETVATSNPIDGREVVDGLLSITKSLPIPLLTVAATSAEVLVGLIFKREDSLIDVHTQLTDIEKQIQGFYEQVKRANKTTIIFKQTNDIYVAAEAIRKTIVLNTQEEIDKLDGRIDKMFESFSGICLTLPDLASNYESDFRSSKVNLSEYILGYNRLYEVILNPVNIAIDASDSVRSFLQEKIDSKKTSRDDKKKYSEIISSINFNIQSYDEKTKAFIGDGNKKGSLFEKFPQWLANISDVPGADTAPVRLELEKNNDDFMCCEKKQLDSEKCSFVTSLKKDIAKHPDNYYKHWKISIVENEKDPANSPWFITLNEKDLFLSPHVYAKFYTYSTLVNDQQVNKSEWQAFVGSNAKRIKPTITEEIESISHFTIMKLIDNKLRFEFDLNGKTYCLEAGTKQKMVDARIKDEQKKDQQWKVVEL